MSETDPIGALALCLLSWEECVAGSERVVLVGSTLLFRTKKTD